MSAILQKTSLYVVFIANCVIGTDATALIVYSPGDYWIEAPGKDPYLLKVQTANYFWDGTDPIGWWPSSCITKEGTPVNCQVIIEVEDTRNGAKSPDFTAEHKADVTARHESLNPGLENETKYGDATLKFDCYAYALQRYNVRLNHAAFIQFGIDGHLLQPSNPGPQQTQAALHGVGALGFYSEHASWNISMRYDTGYPVPYYLSKHGSAAIYDITLNFLVLVYNLPIGANLYFDKP